MKNINLVKAHIYRDELFPVYELNKGIYYNGDFFNVPEQNLEVLLKEQKKVWAIFDAFQMKLKAIYEEVSP